MTFKLSKYVQVGQKIQLPSGWKKVVGKSEESVTLDDWTEMKFGEEILGWKA